MYLEYIAGPILALLLGMKFSDYKQKQCKQTMTELQAKVEQLEVRNAEVENELAKKMMATVLPVAKAVNKLNQQVGL